MVARRIDDAAPHPSPRTTWRIHDAGRGCVIVYATKSRVSPDDLGRLLSRLNTRCGRGQVRRIVMNLARVDQIGPQWTIFLAMLIDFARRSHVHVSLESLHGQPAAIVDLCRESPEFEPLN